MKEKNILLHEIDGVIKDLSTSPENRELLSRVRLELVKAKNKEEFLAVALKIAEIIGALVNLGGLAKIFTNSR